MPATQVVTIISRALAIYFLAWFLDGLTILPSDLHSLFHHSWLGGTQGASYWRDYYLLILSFRLLRMIILFFAVQWFYRAGPMIQRYFLSASEHDSDAIT